MPKYLVTGGCGFIGSNLVDALLASGHAVRVLDDLSTGFLSNKAAAAEFVHGDVADRVTVEESFRDVDGCFHLAAVASVQRANEDWVGTHRTNLTGSLTVFDVARTLNSEIPVVYASSAAVYGSSGDLPLSERIPGKPLSPYGADKLATEFHARAGGHVHGLRTCGLRFFNVYGPRQDPKSPYSGVISIFLDRMNSGLPLTIHGDGRQSRDFIFVRDVVRALQAALVRACPKAPVFNVCTGHSTSLVDLVSTMGQVNNQVPKVHFAPARDGDIRTSVGDPSAAAVELSFRADVCLREGLAALR